MKLKTSLQISGVFPIVMALLVILGLLARSRAIEQARSDARLAEEIVRRVAEAYSSLQTCLVRRSAEARKAWDDRVGALERFLGDEMAKGAPRKSELGPLMEKTQAARQNASRLLDLRSAAPEPPVPSEEILRLEKAIADHLESLLMAAVRFARATGTGSHSAERAADKFLMVFVAIAGLALTGLTVAASRDVVRRLQRLKEASAKVAAGDFTVQIESVMGDELSESFLAFNEMVARVQQAINKLKQERDDWKQEYEKGYDAANKARQANMSLADALTKLKRAQQQIVQQERLRALEQIVKGVARDFAATIMPVVSTIDFLTAYPENLNDRQSLVEHLRHIHEAAREAERQVRLLSEVFLTPEKRASEAVDVNQAVRKAIEVVEESRKATGAADVSALAFNFRAGQVPAVEGEPTELAEAIANLIQNAAEAMPVGGKVEISTRVEGDKVLIDVSDSGEGMSEEVRQRCLEPFFSTKGAGHSGMGLTYVVAATGRYGGSVDIHSTPGTGTAVVLTLPAYKGEKAPQARPRPKTKIDRKLKILVIDDEEYVRKILSKGLGAEGHIVDTASSGREGLKKGGDNVYDLVILDRAMPDLVGEEVAVGIRQKRPNAPILLLTGMGDLMKKEGELPRSVDAVLSKPITTSELTRAIASVLEKRGHEKRGQTARL